MIQGHNAKAETEANTKAEEEERMKFEVQAKSFEERKRGEEIAKSSDENIIREFIIYALESVLQKTNDADAERTPEVEEVMKKILQAHNNLAEAY
ncbi:hypothetical protein L1887_38002 [Cichorium endivia]|nr:hypothetical protein L1887_38002 [Cichorium endivia]